MDAGRREIQVQVASVEGGVRTECRYISQTPSPETENAMNVLCSRRFQPSPSRPCTQHQTLNTKLFRLQVASRGFCAASRGLALDAHDWELRMLKGLGCMGFRVWGVGYGVSVYLLGVRRE